MKSNFIKKINYHLILYLIPSFLLINCYVLGGGASSISKNIKTIEIEEFSNNAPRASAELVNNLNLELRTLFQNRAKLTLVESDGHIKIKGTFIDYRAAPINPSSDSNMATGSQIKAKVSISYSNKEEPQRDFTNREFENTNANQLILDSGETLLDGDQKHGKVLAKDLALSIYNAIASDW